MDRVSWDKDATLAWDVTGVTPPTTACITTSPLSTLLPFVNLPTLNLPPQGLVVLATELGQEKGSVYWAGVLYPPKKAEKGAGSSAEAPWNQVNARTLFQGESQGAPGPRGQSQAHGAVSRDAWRRKREEISATNPKVQEWKARSHSEHSS